MAGYEILSNNIYGSLKGYMIQEKSSPQKVVKGGYKIVHRPQEEAAAWAKTDRRKGENFTITKREERKMTQKKDEETENYEFLKMFNLHNCTSRGL